MEERRLDETGENALLNANLPVPPARPLSDFCMEHVGDDVVLYDPEAIQYHTLNSAAYAVWRQCDGQRTIEEVRRALDFDGYNLHSDAVLLAVAQLDESGLLEVDERTFEVRVQRRKVLKLAAVGIITAVGLPVVSSITAPDAAAQNSCGGPCASPNVCCTASGPCRLPLGSSCTADSQCCPGALCRNPGCNASGSSRTCRTGCPA